MKIDYLIVGQGLAGSLLAWQLLARGKRVLVVDRDETDTSSKVAAGLVNPIAGARFHIPPGLEERLQFARKFYWEREEELQDQFYHHVRMIRLFRNQEERDRWEKKKRDGDSFLQQNCLPLEVDESIIPNHHGGFETRGSGWLDVPRFLEHTRQHLLERAAYAIGKVKSRDVAAHEYGVQWKNIFAEGVIFCQGWRGDRNHFFERIPMNPVKGEILKINCPNLIGETRIINKGGWLLPQGNGTFRAGSNYDHGFTDAQPGDRARNEIEQKIRGITNADFHVVGHRAGIRPVIRRSQVIAGSHPKFPRVAFFNGLGSKGVSNGPFYANALAEHLTSGAPLPSECRLSEYFDLTS